MVAKIGYYKGSYIGDMPKGKGGKALGYSGKDRNEANAFFRYFVNIGRKPQMWAEKTHNYVTGKDYIRYYVYWQRTYLKSMVPSGAKRVK
jgi:hypothetical protein